MTETDRALRAVVVGYGYWGPNLARNLDALESFELVAVCEPIEARHGLIRGRHRGVLVLPSLASAIEQLGSSLDAVFIATPVHTHHNLALEALEAGLHVFVEKPLASSSSESLAMIQAAESRGLKLGVGHTFIFTGAVRRMRSLIQSGELGKLLYFDSCRVNLGLLQEDVDVSWDLAVHDIAILNFVTGKQPVSVTAVGIAHPPSRQRSAAYLTFLYDDAFSAHVNVNWMSPVKIRRTLVGGSRRMIVWDDLEPSEKIRIYDSGVDEVLDPEARRSRLVEYRTGDMLAPRVDQVEALSRELQTFADAINSGHEIPNSGRHGLEVIRALEAAGESMNLGGQPVQIS